jgi:DTW domain-containing protein YfiP
LCAAIPKLDLATRVVIFMQRSERKLLTNTGILAHRVLTNSQIIFRGHESRQIIKREDFLNDAKNENTFILFPTDHAVELNDSFLKNHPGPLTLICPDGHWGQAKRVVRREPSLQNIPFVKLPQGSISNYRLRRNQLENHVCTMEAIMLALGLIEGLAVQNAMEEIFNKMVTRLLWLRGKITKDQVVW